MRTLHFLLITFLAACQTTPKMDSTPTTITAEDYLFIGTYTKKEGHVDGKGLGIHILK